MNQKPEGRLSPPSEPSLPGTNEPPVESRAHRSRRSRHRVRLTIILVIVLWTFLYNILIKELGVVRAFFEILDTISDDFVMGTLFTILLGFGIVAAFSLTKLYTQIIANVYSFKILEDLVHEELRKGQIKNFLSKLIHFEDQPHPESVCPTRVSSLLISFAFLYVMSWVYLMLFSEALFFVSWSAGVDLPITEKNLLLLPTLALAIPFSARVMAYLEYPYAQDYADFMPGAVFVLLVVLTLGYLFQSDDQKFFLTQVFAKPEFLLPFLRNGVFLSFIPVFFEGAFWLLKLSGEDEQAAERARAPASPLDGPAAPARRRYP